MSKGLAALANITAAATAALLLHGCGKAKEEEPAATEADADAAAGVHKGGPEAAMNQQTQNGKHARAKQQPDANGDVPGAETEFGGKAYRILQFDIQI